MVSARYGLISIGVCPVLGVIRFCRRESEASIWTMIWKKNAKAYSSGCSTLFLADGAHRKERLVALSIGLAALIDAWKKND